jgi:hypothetical protein
MKLQTALLFLLATVHTSPVSAFLGGQHNPSTAAVRFMASTDSETSTTTSTVDLSIPYDAAARLAYDEWRTKYDKGDFNPERYAVFQQNYEAITVANVVAKKQARDQGEAVPALMSLNEFGDCTEEEYKAAMEDGSSTSTTTPTTTGDVLGKAMESAQSQSEASNALKDAADALAEEEEVCVKSCVPIY